MTVQKFRPWQELKLKEGDLFPFLIMYLTILCMYLLPMYLNKYIVYLHT
jgi:hypothetical protein